MNDDDVEDSQPATTPVSHQEVWALFEKVWSSVIEVRWVELGDVWVGVFFFLGIRNLGFVFSLHIWKREEDMITMGQDLD